MAAENKRILREKKTIRVMMGIYCRQKHGPEGQLCPDCAELLEYAYVRLDRCRYQADKPTCGNCPTHCYKPSMLKKIMAVMRFSGPRMTFRHPVLAMGHLMDSFKKVPEKPALKRQASNK